MPDATCSGVDQHALALRKLAVSEQALPGREAGQRHAAGRNEIEVVRDSHDLVGRDRDVLAVSPFMIRRHGKTGLAYPPGFNTGANSGNFAGHIVAEDGRQFRLLEELRAGAFAHLAIDRVDAGGNDADFDVSGARLGPVNLRKLKVFRAAERVQAYGVHQHGLLLSYRFSG